MLPEDSIRVPFVFVDLAHREIRAMKDLGSPADVLGKDLGI